MCRKIYKLSIPFIIYKSCITSLQFVFVEMFLVAGSIHKIDHRVSEIECFKENMEAPLVAASIEAA